MWGSMKRVLSASELHSVPSPGPSRQVQRTAAWFSNLLPSREELQAPCLGLGSDSWTWEWDQEVSPGGTEMGQDSQASPEDTGSRASFRKHMETQAGTDTGLYRQANLQSTVRHPQWGQMGRVGQESSHLDPGVRV